MSMAFVGKQLDGIWHTGICVYNIEYYFGGGILTDKPLHTPYGHPVQTIPLGSTDVPKEIFEEFIDVNSYLALQYLISEHAAIANQLQTILKDNSPLTPTPISCMKYLGNYLCLRATMTEIIRLLMLRQDANSYFANASNKLIGGYVEKLQRKELSKSTELIVYRLMVNCFAHPKGIDFLFNTGDLLSNTIECAVSGLHSNDKVLKRAVSTVVYDLSIHLANDVHVDSITSLLVATHHILSVNPPAEDPEIDFRLLMALGTLPIQNTLHFSNQSVFVTLYLVSPHAQDLDQSQRQKTTCRAFPMKNGALHDFSYQLLTLVQDSQYKENSEFKDWSKWQLQKGEFPSHIHINFVGNIEKTEARRNLAIPDSNAFVTNFVTYTLLQAQKLGTIQPNVSVIDSAIDAILSYSDKNGVDGNGIYNFWPQVYNATGDMYESYPLNLDGLINMYGGFEEAADLLAIILKKNNLIEDMKIFGEMIHGLQTVFHIPPDGDDTGCTLALGHVLSEFSSIYPRSAAVWAGNNSNIAAAIAGYQAFAYRPFASSLDANGIDPRTYYALQEFLLLWTTEMGRTPESLVLPGTWFLDISSQNKTFPYLQMPFNVNNVDFSVAMNALFGISSAIFESDTDIITQDLSDMLTSIALLIEWSVDSGMVYNRTDIALLYYPSLYDFSWFIGRTTFFLEEFSLVKPLPAPLDFVLDTLRAIGEGNVTTQLLNRMLKDNKNGVYWDDFLGNDDTLFGEPIKYGEDRFFSSSLALNALFDCWSMPVANQPGVRTWKTNTPAAVRSTLHLGSAYIDANILDHPEQTFNSFFSGSVKGASTMATSYPSNACVLFNGDTCNSHNPNPNDEDVMVAAMSGVVSEATYQVMIKETWFNHTVPTNWTGFNPSLFPFWSSTPLTHSLSMLALSKAIVLNA
eukprot:gene15514-18425_t